jgi:hypothetical protein
MANEITDLQHRATLMFPSVSFQIDDHEFPGVRATRRPYPDPRD